jgi:hypothetical protein
VPARAVEKGGSGEANEMTGLRRELEQLKFSALKKRAVAAGVCGEDLEKAEDSDTPKAALLEVLVHIEKARLEAGESVAVSDAMGIASKPMQAALEALRQELGGLKMSALKKRALAAGVGEEELDDTADSDNPKGAVVGILIGAERAALEAAHLAAAEAKASAAAVAKSAQQRLAAARQDLLALRASDVRKRARARGVGDEALDEAEDAPNPRVAIVDLIMQMDEEAATATDGGASAVAVAEGLRLQKVKFTGLTQNSQVDPAV